MKHLKKLTQKSLKISMVEHKNARQYMIRVKPEADGLPGRSLIVYLENYVCLVMTTKVIPITR